MEPPQIVEQLPLTVSCPFEPLSDKTIILFIVIIITIMYNYTNLTTSEFKTVDWDVIDLIEIEFYKDDDEREDGREDVCSGTEPVPGPVGEPVPEPVGEPLPGPVGEPLPGPVGEPLPKIVKGSVFYSISDKDFSCKCPLASMDVEMDSMDMDMESIMGTENPAAFYLENSIFSMTVFIIVIVLSTLFNIVKIHLYQIYLIATYLPLLMCRRSGFSEKLLDEIEEEYDSHCMSFDRNVIRGIAICKLFLARITTSFFGRLIFNQNTLSYMLYYILTCYVNRCFSQSS